jgi:hypothetical protein
MGLVGAGLLVILARILAKRSMPWLIGTNICLATCTLYVCSFVNFSAIIADYNVRHCSQLTGEGVPLDLNYISELGPQALPAMGRGQAGLAGSPETLGVSSFGTHR